MNVQTIGIIGAGKLGTVLAQLALKAGYAVYISNSGDPKKIELTVSALAPGAVATTNRGVATDADVIILALPFSKIKQLAPENFTDKLIIDATNYWWEVDGPREEIMPDEQSSSEAVQAHLSTARIVKTFSHMGYHHLHDEAKPENSEGRKALAVAGDSQTDVNTASEIVSRLGFDPVAIGPLANGRRLEPGSPAFGASVDKTALLDLLK